MTTHDSRPSRPDARTRTALGGFVKLRRAVNSLTARLNPVLQQAHGLTESQFGVLEALWHLGPMPQIRLCEKLLVSGSNLTTVIDNLERRDLVRRDPNPDDRRAYLVRLTVSNASGEGVSTATITATNPPPASDAGGNRAAYLGETVTLDSHASDPDGEPLTFAWTLVSKPAGSTAALSAGATATTSFVPDVAGQYLVSLVVSDPGATLPEQVVAVTAYRALAPLAHRVLDAEYSKALDAIVMLDEAPNALYVYDPVARTEKKILLPLPGTSVGVSPDGLTAVVGHNAFVTRVDLVAGSIIKTWPVAAVLGR